MLKKSILVALLGCCAAAQAGDYHAVIATYTGFADYNTGVFDPNRKETLRAIVNDINGDGNFTVNEVLDISFYAVSIDSWDIEWYGHCGSNDMSSSWCINSFSYKSSDHSLTFDVYDGGRDFDASWGGYAKSGVTAYSYFQYTSGEDTGLRYTGIRWTPQTTVTINVTSAVPEPSTYAMLGVGLCAVGALARRRRKQ